MFQSMIDHFSTLFMRGLNLLHWQNNPNTAGTSNDLHQGLLFASETNFFNVGSKDYCITPKLKQNIEC